MARREPFAVERLPGVGGGVVLIGYDENGEALAELRMSALAYDDVMVTSLRRIVKLAHRPAPRIGIVP